MSTNKERAERGQQLIEFYQKSIAFYRDAEELDHSTAVGDMIADLLHLLQSDNDPEALARAVKNGIGGWHAEQEDPDGQPSLNSDCEVLINGENIEYIFLEKEEAP